MLQSNKANSGSILTNQSFQLPKFTGKNLEKVSYCWVIFQKYPLRLVRFFPLVWHLWQQKNNIAVGMCTRTHIRNSCVRAQGGRRMSVRYEQAMNQKRNTPRLCNAEIAKSRYIEFKMSLFCDFFPLWGNIDPYIFRGASSAWSFLFYFHFHGESQSNIYPLSKHCVGKVWQLFSSSSLGLRNLI